MGTRVWILSKKSYLFTIPVFLFGFAIFGFGVYTIHYVLSAGHFTLLLSLKNVNIAQDATLVVADVVLTAELTYLLHRSKSGIKSTDALIARILFFGLTRGIITAIMAIISLILFITKPFSLSYLILLLPGAQMYCIMVVALLGARSGHSASGVHIHSSGSGSHSDPIHSHISSNARVNASVDAYRLYPMPTSPGILKQEQSVNIDKVENDTDSDQEMIKVPQVDADSDLESGLQVKATYHPADSYEVGQ